MVLEDASNWIEWITDLGSYLTIHKTNNVYKEKSDPNLPKKVIDITIPDKKLQK